MSSINVEKDLLFSSDDCHKIATKCFQSKEYELKRYYLEDLGDTGGFLGKYYRLNIEVVVKNEPKLLRFFIKTLPKGAKVLTEMAELSFRKEQFMYERFFPKLEDLGILTFTPKFYLCKLNEAIVLEDLSEKGYRANATRSFLDYDSICSALKQLARLHASTIIFEERRSKEHGRMFRMDDDYKDYLFDVAFSRTGPTANLFDTAITTQAQVAVRFPDIPKKMSMSEFQTRIIQNGQRMYEITKKSTKYRNVICQGDMWPPNIMLKRNQEGVECYLVDYQLTRYCPLMFELSFFLYICTRKHLRRNHMKEFLDRYYQEFAEVLKSCQIEVSEVYTYDQFLESYYDITPTTISKALSYLQIGLLPPERLSLLRQDFKEFDYVLKVDRVGFYEKHDVFKDDVFRNTLRELYEDLYDSFQARQLGFEDGMGN
nr:unnamed protein product [Callosobruchus chinensis]